MGTTKRLGMLAVLLASLLTACDKSSDTPTAANKPAATTAAASIAAPVNEVAPSWEAHLDDYPKGWIAAEAPLYIRFTHPVVSPEQVDKAFDPDQLKWDLKIPFNLVFTSPTELRITPAERLPSDTSIHLHLSPKGLDAVEDSLDDFAFEVHTIKQDFDLKVNGLIVLETDDALMQLTGSVVTDDTADLEQVKHILSAKANGAKLAIDWSQDSDRKTNRFTINNIERQDKAGVLHLDWDGSAIGSTDKGGRDLGIPAQQAFEVTGASVTHYPQTHIEVQFSDELDKNQNLRGLVSFADKTNVKTEVDGSTLKIFPSTDEPGELELTLNRAIKSAKRRSLGEDYHQSLVIKMVMPQVNFVGQTSILPPGAQISVPFEAAGVDSVQIVAFKVFANNVGEYLQDNTLTSANADVQTGRYLWRKVYRLPEIPKGDKQRFNLDLTQLMAQHPEGIVRLELRIDRSNSIYHCEQPRPTEPVQGMPDNSDGESYYEREEAEPEWYRQYYGSNGYYNYSERNNPCNDTYYDYGDNVRSARNFFLSNIGLMAKRGDGKTLNVVATQLTSADPLSNAKITAYNYQLQPIGTGTTDSYGMVEINTDGVPFYIQARAGDQIGYLRLRNNEALPTNQFDVSGEQVKGGLKGAIYGERDVWRPGDDVFLTFVLEDKSKQLPPKHPVTLDVFDPRGKKVVSQTNVQPVNGFYTFKFATEESAPTGNYRAVVHVGNRYFDKLLKIETITPNRIKVELTPAASPLSVATMPTQVELFAQWLQGATAKNLKADSELKLLPRKTQFDGYAQFVFDDEARSFTGSSQQVFDGQLDDKGKASFPLDISLSSPPPGMLTAQFVTRVFEESGNFSTIMRPYEFHPYSAWVGLNIPKGSGYMDAISRDEDHDVLVQSLDDKGKPLASRHVQISVYEIGWRWWWDEEEDNIADYINNQNYRAAASEDLVTDQNGRLVWHLQKNKYDWGRHLVRVCDMDVDSGEGHCASKVVYLGWSWDQGLKSDAATQLMLSTDKTSYQVGETAKIRLPSASEGRVLLSLENGSRVLQSRWLDLKPNQTDIEIPVTAEMAPNVYANIAILLPHQKRVAETPMRLYGIVPILVENPQTRLQPQVDVPEKVRPETEFSIKVSEQQGRAMTYTLAVVDEGLLGLTNFHAPDLHDNFFKREALGVRTWDLFDQVVGGYGASLERVLAIGGSDAAQDAERKRRERRFPPVVKFLGAFELKAGETREHKVKLPPYMGAVRVMLVAGNTGAENPNAKDTAYGTAEKTVTVTQPVTLFATLPRVLGPGEEVALPVNVFVSDAAYQDVSIKVETNEIFTVVKGEDSLHFSEPGDAIALLRLKVNDRIGKGRVKVTAVSGNESAEQEIYIDSRSANLPTTVSQSKVLQPGETWESPLAPNGMFGTNQASVEVSSLPPLNLEKRLQYLIQYPHGCVEQTTSSVFPQLHLKNLTQMSDAQKQQVDSNIAAGIKRLQRFQHASGGFTYWPGDSYVNDWASNYAGHFLVEAKRAGYNVPGAMFDNWVKYQRSAARDTHVEGHHYYYDESVLAYRLYTLALADKAELASMNRLREIFKTTADSEVMYYRATARWLLALAYQQIGLNDAAADVLGQVTSASIPNYKDWGYTYGSDMRDRGILIMALNHMAQNSDLAWQLATEEAKSLSSQDWYSTQSIAWALLAMSDFAEKNGTASGEIKFSLKEEGAKDWVSKSTAQIFYSQAVASPKLSLRNDQDKPVHVMVSNRGIPANLYEEPGQAGLQMNVAFMTLDNKPLDILHLPQGQDFVAEVTVSADFEHMVKNRIEDIALSAVVPSGWQIRNERLEGSEMPKGIDYMDIRDDRVLAYFSLWRDYYWYYRYQDRNRTSVTLRIILNASYAGKFYLPGWNVSAMYDETLFAKNKGNWVEVVGK